MVFWLERHPATYGWSHKTRATAGALMYVQYINLGCDSYLPADASDLPAGSNNSFFIGLGGRQDLRNLSVFNLMNLDDYFTQPKTGGYSFLTGYQSSLSVRMGNEFLSNGDLPGTFDRVAESMMDYICINLDLKGVSGMMYVQETFLEVVWGWFGLPVALVLLAMVFLALTIATNKSWRRLKGLLAVVGVWCRLWMGDGRGG